MGDYISRMALTYAASPGLRGFQVLGYNDLARP